MKNELFDVVNRNHEVRITMDKVYKDLYYVRLAKRLNRISARRKK